MRFTTIYAIKQGSQCCQKDVTNSTRVYLTNFASYNRVTMPKPEDDPSKKRKNSASELAQHEPAQEKNPSERIPATAPEDIYADMAGLGPPEPDDEIGDESPSDNTIPEFLIFFSVGDTSESNQGSKGANNLPGCSVRARRHCRRYLVGRCWCNFCPV